MRECCRAFWRGATRPSLASLLLALTVNVIIVAALCVSVTPRTIVDKNGFLLTYRHDNHAVVTAKALTLHSSAESSARSIVVLGTSTTVLCITSEQGLAELVREKSGIDAVAHDMCMDAQSTWEMAALVNYLPSHFSGVVVFGMTPGLLSNGVAEGTGVYLSSLSEVLDSHRLGFVSHALDAEARLAGLHVPFRTGIYVWDNRNFFLSRRRAIVRNLLLGPLVYADPMDAEWLSTLNREESWRKTEAELPDLIARYEKYSQLNLSVIRRITVDFRPSSRVSFLVMASPINPAWGTRPTGAAFHSRYLDDVRQFASENEMPFLDISAKAGLVSEDFADARGHIGNRPARERCTGVLASRVAHLLTESLDP